MLRVGSKCLDPLCKHAPEGELPLSVIFRETNRHYNPNAPKSHNPNCTVSASDSVENTTWIYSFFQDIALFLSFTPLYLS